MERSVPSRSRDRRKTFHLRNSFIVATMASTLFTAAGKAASVVVYVEPPTLQLTSVAGVATESFDEMTNGVHSTAATTPIGTYQANSSSKFAVLSADQYGGSGGTGKYFAVGTQSSSLGPLRLNLNAEANYFGFWWSAGDKYNSITFLQDGVAYATFTTAQIITLLPYSHTTKVTAINGLQYNTFNYYGNPNASQDPGEPFAYVDVIATGLVFDQVEFSNGTLNSGFETDNHSVAAGVTAPPPVDVIVQDVPLTPAATAGEPGSLLLLAGGLLSVALARSGHRRPRT